MHKKITDTELDGIRGVIPKYYGRKRFSHALSVERECASLAAIYELSENDALRLRAAALLHDVTKKLSHDEQLCYCRENGIPFTEEESHMPKIFHARTGAHFAAKLFPELVDDEIYGAILSHTTAKPAMGMIDALLYLADYIEPEREFPDCALLRAEFYAALETMGKTEALKMALVRSFDYTLTGLITERGLIHGDVIAARNYYLLQNGEGEKLK